MNDDEPTASPEEGSPHFVVSQLFRDAFACHLYMLFSVMFFMESEAKIGSSIKTGGKNRADNQESDETVAMRAECANAMLEAAKAMGKNRNKLWKRGVADDTVVGLPCRISYQMLESATGVIARKAASGDAAIAMIATTVDSCDSLLGTIVAALVDMLHSFEHMAVICAEICCLVSDKPTNKLAVELIREIGRLDTNDDTGKASGIKFVAPFINELAACKPRIVLGNISHILPHLNSEPYYLRSAIVTALGHIVEHIGKSLKTMGNIQISEEEGDQTEISRPTLEKSRGNLLDILEERTYDVSSYTRSSVLKAWISLSHGGSIPVERVISVTILAIDRLKDKTVIVRKQALQVRSPVCSLSCADFILFWSNLVAY